MRKLLKVFILAAFALTFLVKGIYAEAFKDTNVKVVQTFQGTVPGDPPFGDGYGAIVQLHKYCKQTYLYAVAPTAGEFGQDSISAGAVYVYRDSPNQHSFSLLQIIQTAGLLDQVGTESTFPAGDWLFISANGTPLGDIQPDFTLEDFTGSVLIYRLNKKTGFYEFVQVLDRNVPGLGGLTPFTEENPLGAAFGNILSVDLKAGWLFVGGISQSVTQDSNTVFNCGQVYAFKLDKHTQTWKLAQTFTNPVSGLIPNDNFGTNVFVKGKYAVITNGDDTVQPQAHVTNSSAYVYKLKRGQWVFVQQLQGDQSQSLSDAIGMFDGFGCALWMSDDWMLIGAPFESTISKFNGAAYFFHKEFDPISEKEFWVKRQKVISPDTTSQQQCLTVFNAVQITGNEAVIGAPGSVGPNGLYQGSVLVYKLDKHERWNFIAQLFDPEGKSYDYFGTGCSVRKHLVFGGTFPTMDQFLNDRGTVGLIGVDNGPDNRRDPSDPMPPFDNGKAVLFKLSH